mgnify:CR=1 FL=1
MQDPLTEIRDRLTTLEVQGKERWREASARFDRIENTLKELPHDVKQANGHSGATLGGWAAAGAAGMTAIGAIAKAAGWW